MSGIEAGIEVSLGTVLFLDVDAYLKRAGTLSAEQEVGLFESLRRPVLAAGQDTGVRLVRSFGDGFLFILDGNFEDGDLDRASRFIATVRESFAAAGFTFKGAVVAGPLVLTKGDGSDGSAPSLVGPAANYAGKLIRHANSEELIVAWPGPAAHITRSSTFEDLIARVPAATLSVKDVKVGTSLTLAMLADTKKRPTSAPPETGAFLAFSEQVKVHTGEMVKLADDKAKFALTISAGLLAYLFNLRLPEIIGGQLRTSPLELVASAMLIMGTILLVVTFGSCALVLLPRTSVTHLGLVFFGSVAKWTDAESYWLKVKSMEPLALARESSCHNFDYARVTSLKYVHLRRAMRCMIAGLACVLIYFVVWDGWIAS